ncbi:MAG: hypothetical protein JWQ81_691 [Amycolatopsis sp.]|nr:hypothetical protein [Amycolatopsis sp.]
MISARDTYGYLPYGLTYPGCCNINKNYLVSTDLEFATADHSLTVFAAALAFGPVTTLVNNLGGSTSRSSPTRVSSIRRSAFPYRWLLAIPSRIRSNLTRKVSPRSMAVASPAKTHRCKVSA